MSAITHDGKLAERPLTCIDKLPGEIVGTEIERKKGRWMYEFRVVDDRGGCSRSRRCPQAAKSNGLRRSDARACCRGRPADRVDVSRTLEASGYVVETVANGEDAWFLGDTEDYGAVILDLGLPGMDGLAVLKRWRANGRHMPVLILTARGSWAERVDGIDAGADDYLPKPFRMEELLARLRSIVRRSAGHGSRSSTAGEITLDERQMKVDPSRRADHAFAARVQAGRLISSATAGGSFAAGARRERLRPREAHDWNAFEVLVGRVRKKLGADHRDAARVRLSDAGGSDETAFARLRLVAGGIVAILIALGIAGGGLASCSSGMSCARSPTNSMFICANCSQASTWIPRIAWWSIGRLSIRGSPNLFPVFIGRSATIPANSSIAILVGYDAGTSADNLAPGEAHLHPAQGPNNASVLVRERKISLTVGGSRQNVQVAVAGNLDRVVVPRLLSLASCQPRWGCWP